MSKVKYNLEISEIYKPIIELAIQIGEFQKEAFETKTFEIHTKSSDVDLVTEIDLESDKRIVKTISQHFIGDSILSEEEGLKVGSNDYQWIIDPLDGTTNFSIGHPIFAISIARWKSDDPIFGLVYVPMLNALYIAEKDKGAYFNGKRIAISHQVDLKKSVIGTGFPYDRATATNNNGENVRKIVPMVKGIRRLGAAAYDLCLVASGVYDAFWELRLSKWDLAAGKLMILESGGSWHEFVENDKYNIVTGSATLCDQLNHELNLRNGERGV